MYSHFMLQKFSLPLKYTEALVIASKEIDLEVYAEKTKYMVMSRD